MACDIHPTASISPKAQLGVGVVVKPYAVISDDVHIGDNVIIEAHAVIHPRVSLGAGCTVGDHAVLGGAPQDIGFDTNMPTGVVIGERTVVREYATIHAATNPDIPTTIGSDCLLMVAMHIGHDCRVGNSVVLSNHSALAGHVVLDDKVIVGGYVHIHQFVRIGRYAFLSPSMLIRKDVLPYHLLSFSHKNNKPCHWRLNRVGLERGGVSEGARHAIVDIHKKLKCHRPIDWSGYDDDEELIYFQNWLSYKSKSGQYGFLAPRNA